MSFTIIALGAINRKSRRNFILYFDDNHNNNKKNKYTDYNDNYNDNIDYKAAVDMGV